MSEVNSIDNFPKYLLDKGLLFEINRKVLNPLGLMMFIDNGRVKKSQVFITALLQAEDLDGFFYDPESFEVGEEAYKKYLEREGQERLDDREKKYGFLVQEEAEVQEK